ncbi:hypothetical protein PMAYCL1PPCAC_23507 [Pristionchus mayeri]|uniref:ERCC1-like central domain-containing protein n=1 Tax=Pristionchus mayeri TaxID=1317129 RepID=A0AAN5CZD9_9BILA|nr:hypothetical protein PMAYCL1PPCAC_23507 [Pristionchus mayeri]
MASSSTGMPPVTRNASASGVVINRKRQQGNPLLQYIRLVRYEWGEVACDIEIDSTIGIVFLTLSYHKLHNQYIHTRLTGKNENKYASKILLVVDNVTESRHSLRELSLLCFRMGWTLIVAKGIEEAAEYIESIKLVESKEPGGNKKKEVKEDERSQLADEAIRIVSGARGVTKTDAKRVLASFGTLRRLTDAKETDLGLCEGIGPVRGPNLVAYLNTPFLS